MREGLFHKWSSSMCCHQWPAVDDGAFVDVKIKLSCLQVTVAGEVQTTAHVLRSSHLKCVALRYNLS